MNKSPAHGIVGLHILNNLAVVYHTPPSCRTIPKIQAFQAHTHAHSECRSLHILLVEAHQHAPSFQPTHPQPCIAAFAAAPAGNEYTHSRAHAHAAPESGSQLQRHCAAQGALCDGQIEGTNVIVTINIIISLVV